MLIHKRRREENAALFHAEVSKEDVRSFEGPSGLDIEFKHKVLADILTCKLCKGFFCEAHTIKECLHTFCRSCIVGYIHNEGNKCPTCGEAFQSQNKLEDLSYDRQIQTLVDKLFPNFQKEEEQRRKTLFEFCGFPVDEENRPVNACDLAEYNTSGGGSRLIGPNAIDLRTRPGFKRTTFETISTPQFSSLRNSNETEEEVPKTLATPQVATEEFLVNAKQILENKDSVTCKSVTIRLTPADESTPELPMKYIRVPISMSVKFLMEYVLFRLEKNLDDWQNVTLTCTNAPLARTHSLEFVCRIRRFQFDNPSAILDIKYKLPENETPTEESVV
eukprot:GDKJ01002846.1.p1 GENE.GDKJ01002846.1~~GDKJ01002846.1.p1  ORF type:complete len:333 (-),score=43.06 GDKJ01002846.1:41-1039(-)